MLSHLCWGAIQIHMQIGSDIPAITGLYRRKEINKLTEAHAFKAVIRCLFIYSSMDSHTRSHATRAFFIFFPCIFVLSQVGSPWFILSCLAIFYSFFFNYFYLVSRCTILILWCNAVCRIIKVQERIRNLDMNSAWLHVLLLSWCSITDTDTPCKTLDDFLGAISERTQFWILLIH